MGFHLNASVIRPLCVAFPVFLTVAVTGCGQGPATDPVATQPSTLPALASPAWTGPVPAGHYAPEIARAWFDLSYVLVRNERWSPPVASRFWGYAGMAVYEAVSPGIAGYPTLAGQIQGLEKLPKASGPAYHWPLVVNAALHEVFSGFYAGASAGSKEEIEDLHAEWDAALRRGVPAGIYKRSVEFGREIGATFLECSHQDGYDTYNNCAYILPSGPGVWVATGAVLSPLQPCWGEIRTCVVENGAACDPGLPPPFSTQAGSEFHNEAIEVYEVGNTLTAEQLAIANFWADAAGATGTPSGHWISIAGQVIEQEEVSLDRAAEAYARTGIAAMDAFICCWNTKYAVNLLRPVTYIKSYIDAGWNPKMATPAFPEYTSGHSTQSAAVAEVLTDMFGEISFTDRTHEPLGFGSRSFDSFQDAADEAAISRLYGGIHFRSAIEDGVEQGRCVGEAVNRLRWGREAS